MVPDLIWAPDIYVYGCGITVLQIVSRGEKNLFLPTWSTVIRKKTDGAAHVVKF